jgi:hypothetical protein
MSESISSPGSPILLPNRPIRNRAFTPLYLLLTSNGNPSQWTTCLGSHPPRGAMTVFLRLLIAFPRLRLWPPTRRITLQRPLPSYYLNASQYTLGSHKPLSHIGMVSSSTHSGRSSSHCWIPSSPNPLPSTPRQISKLRSLIG